MRTIVMISLGVLLCVVPSLTFSPTNIRTFHPLRPKGAISQRTCASHASLRVPSLGSSAVLHVALSANFAELSDEELLEVWWSSAQEGDADSIRALHSDSPGILDLVQTDETYVLSELSVRAKDAKKADFAKMGITALHIGCMFGQPTTVSTLLELGANVNALTEDSNAPLHLAVMGGRSEIIKLLVGKGADVEMVNDMGDSPRKMADMMGSPDVKACFS